MIFSFVEVIFLNISLITCCLKKKQASTFIFQMCLFSVLKDSKLKICVSGNMCMDILQYLMSVIFFLKRDPANVPTIYCHFYKYFISFNQFS